MRTRADIERKWGYKIQEMKKKADLKYTILIKRKKERIEQ